MSPLSLDRILVVSPHLDDAVFGCGELLSACPGAVVVTVFAGAPAAGDPLTEWDRAAGFVEGDDVIAARRTEDKAALDCLDAVPVWLEFRDSQYREQPLAATAIAAALAAALARYPVDTVVIPLGLFHSDHQLVHAAALELCRGRSEPAWLGYEDVFYRRIPGLLQARLATLQSMGVSATPVALDRPTRPELKRAATRCYASQLRALGSPGRPGGRDAAAPEGYWRLLPESPRRD